MSNLTIHKKTEFIDLFVIDLRIKFNENKASIETLKTFYNDMSNYSDLESFNSIYDFNMKELQNEKKHLEFKINLTFTNLELILSFLETNNVLSEICHFEDFDNLYISCIKKQNIIKIANGLGIVVAALNIDIKEISSDLISLEDLSLNTYFTLGEITQNYIYNAFRNQYSGHEHLLNLKHNSEKINIINSMFLQFPLCIKDIEIDKLNFSEKQIRTIYDLKTPYRFKGHNLLDETDFKLFIFYHYKPIWDILNIKNELDFENIYLTFNNLKDMIQNKGFGLIMRPSIIDEKFELRFYFNPTAVNIQKGYYFVLPQNHADVLDSEIYLHRDHHSFLTEKTDYIVNDVISGEFIEYLRLLDY